MKSPKVVCLGVHLVDVLAMPVAGPPAPPGRAVIDRIRLTAAGTAAGTAVDLAKLGAEAIAMGAIGDDAAGNLLDELMRGHGVDTRRLVRLADAHTRMSILLIGTDGERHTVLVHPGASTRLTGEDIDLDAVLSADLLHVGGPDALGEFATGALVEVMRAARECGVPTSVDLLGGTSATTAAELAPVFGLASYCFPNQPQIAALTSSTDPGEGARRLRELGAECVVVTLGSEGSLIVDAAGQRRIPACDVEALDTTGCGDGYVAGFMLATLKGCDREAAGWLGAATAGQVASGLGSDAGIVDLASTMAFLAGYAPAGVLTQLESVV